MTLDTKSRIVRNPDIIHVSLGDGTFVLLGSDGLNYFALGETGSSIWEKLESASTLQSLCHTLITEFNIDEATCLAETAAFIETLLSNRFVEMVPQNAAAD